MFALFFSLYYSMFTGAWNMFNLSEINRSVKASVNGVGTFLTSIFGDNQMTTLGDILMDTDSVYYTINWTTLIAFVLALITSIGIVVMAVKGVKKAFGIFFMGLR